VDLLLGQGRTDGQACGQDEDQRQDLVSSHLSSYGVGPQQY
jgi:hypothetical protein